MLPGVPVEYGHEEDMRRGSGEEESWPPRQAAEHQTAE